MEFTQHAVQQHLRGGFGRELVVYQTIGSTNDAAKLLAQNGAPHGAVVVAVQQTAGKGRRGRSFDSPAHRGVYLSVILRPETAAEQSLLVTSAAAVATARAIETVTGVSVQIKWVNDLYYGGKKLCGILAESALQPNGGVSYIVVGIGVNLSGSFTGELAEKACSLEQAGIGKTIDRALLAAEILNELEFVCKTLEDRTFLAEYRRRCCVLGKTVRFLRDGQELGGTATEITDEAHLLVQTEAGETMLLRAGEISLKGDWT